MRFRRRLATLRHALRSCPSARAFGAGGAGHLHPAAFLMLTAQLAVYCGLALPLRTCYSHGRSLSWPVLPLTQADWRAEAAAGGAADTLCAPTFVLAAGLVWEACDRRRTNPGTVAITLRKL